MVLMFYKKPGPGLSRFRQVSDCKPPKHRTVRKMLKDPHPLTLLPPPCSRPTPLPYVYLKP